MGKVKLTLDRYLDGHKITRYRLSEDSGVRYPTIDRYYKNTVKSYDGYILAKICDALDCEISDIIEYIK